MRIIIYFEHLKICFNAIVPLSPLPASVHVTLSGCVTDGCCCWLSVTFCQYRYHYHYSWIKFWLLPCGGDGCKIPIMRCKRRIILHLPFPVPPPVCPELKSLHYLCFENSLVIKMYTNILTFFLTFFKFYCTNKMYTNNVWIPNK